MNLIDNLPSNSAYSEAVSLDERAAEELLEAEERGDVDLNGETRPRRRDFGFTESLLTVIANAIIGLRHDHMVANSKKGADVGRPHFLQGPQSALDRVRTAREEAKWEDDASKIRAAWWPEPATLTSPEPDSPQED